MSTFPPSARPGRRSPSGDAVKYVIDRARFVRPSLRVAPNGLKFEWPGGLEGIRVSGTVGIAQHLYLGDNAPVVQVVHRDSRRIELRGGFLGKTGSANMRGLIEVITSPIPQGYWILNLPAVVFPREQTVVVENYDYDHPEDDRNQSWNYSITMVRTGVGNTISDETSPVTTPPTGTPPSGDPKGVADKTFTTRSGAETLRTIANIVYGDPNKWRVIYEKNKQLFDSFKIPLLQLQYITLGPGFKVNV